MDLVNSFQWLFAGDGFVIPRITRAWGDPHFETLDGMQYTFNGQGEFLGYCSIKNSATASLQDVLDACDPNKRDNSSIRVTYSLEKPFEASLGTIIHSMAIFDPDAPEDNILVSTTGK